MASFGYSIPARRQMIWKRLATTGVAMVAATTAILAFPQPASAGTNPGTVTDGIGIVQWDNNPGDGTVQRGLLGKFRIVQRRDL
jgi:hypothetical protein